MFLFRLLLYYLSFQLAFPFGVRSQVVEQCRIDSLAKILPTMKDDSNKVKLLNEISFTYFSLDPAKGIKTGEQAQSLAMRLQWEKGLAGAFHSLGANYWASHQLIKAQNYYWQDLQINERLDNKAGIARSLHELAITYETQYNYPKAIEYYEKALSVYVVLNDTFSRLGCLANIANVYEVQHKYDDALGFFNQSLQLCTEYGNERHIAYMAGRLGSIYAQKGDYRKALSFETQSLETLCKYPNLYDIASVLSNIGDIYEEQGRHDSALNYYLRAYRQAAVAKGTWTRTWQGRYARKIGSTYLAMSRENTTDDRLQRLSIDYQKRAIRIAFSVRDNESLRDSYQLLSSAQSLAGKDGEALESYKQYVLYKDSLASADHDWEMTRHELEYEYGKKKDSLSYVSELQQSRLTELAQQQQLTRLTVKQQWLYGLAGIAVICLAGSFFIFRYHTEQLKLKNELKREKAEKQLRDAEYQRRINEVTFSALHSQMNPHFIFNALNTIQSFVYSNDKGSASQYLGKFSELIRKILDNSNKERITLEEEIHILQLYIDIEKARFGDSLHADIEKQPGLDMENIFLPPLLIQPFAENAIKHGLLHLSGEKKLLIRIGKSSDDQFVDIVIDDNGIGREHSMAINNRRIGHHSFANAANQRRIELINQMQDKKTRVEIIDKRNTDGAPTGTTVIISIPVAAKPAL